MAAPSLSYLALGAVEQAFDRLAERFEGRKDEAGRSVQDRPIWRYEFGPADGTALLLTGMIHGVELIGGLALWSTVEALLKSELAPRFRLVALPMVNPDAVEANLARLAAGRYALQRTNARGVDLNRNFKVMAKRRPLHPFSGSRFQWSPHYMGPGPLSEPESQAVHQVASEVRPALAFGFHSFGNLLLYPHSYTRVPHPRTSEYRRLGEAFRGAQAQPYKLMQAHGLYPIIGDLDDWLDGELSTLAYTVEVSRPTWALLASRQAVDPFYWMNPPEPVAAVDQVVPGILGALRAYGAPSRSAPVEVEPPEHRRAG